MKSGYGGIGDGIYLLECGLAILYEQEAPINPSEGQRENNLMVEFTGGCLCGTIRYAVNAEPKRIANCHCDDCRKATGAAFATNIFVDADKVVVTQGTPKSYSHTADSGNTMTKQFCGDCGSQLFGFSSGNSGLKSVKVGSIDDAGFVQPSLNLFLKRAAPFTQIDRSITCFDGMPE